MAYLHINGFPIPVRDGHELQLNDLMPRRGYSPNGQYQLARNGITRAWRFQTWLMPLDEAKAFAMMLQGLGDHWRFDCAAANRPTSTTATDFYSDYKRAATAQVATVESALGADGALVYDLNGEAARPFAGVTGSVQVQGASSNLFTAAVSDADDKTQFTALGTPAVFANDPLRYWTGTGSVEVACTTTGDGIRTPAVSVSTTTTYVVSVYVRPRQATTTTVSLTATCDNSGATNTNYTLPANVDSWMRLEHSFTTDGSDTSCTFEVTHANPSAVTFNVDGWQVEAGSIATPFMAGGASRAAGDLYYPNPVTRGANGVTVACWVKSVRLGGTQDDVFAFAESSGEARRLNFLFSAADAPIAQAIATVGGVNSTMQATGSALADNEWHHWAVVYDPFSPVLTIYKDGVSVAEDTTLSGTRVVTPGELDNLYIGQNFAGSNFSPGPITAFSVFPFAAPASFVAGLYNSGAGVGTLHSPGLAPLTAHGPYLGGAELGAQVFAEVRAVTNLPHRDTSLGWQPGGAVVDFMLYEQAKL